MRLFIGLPIAAAVTAELEAICTRLRVHARSLRWTAPEAWHITLQFLGATTPVQFVCVADRLRELRLPPVSLLIDGLGFFDRAGIFCAGVTTTPELLALQQSITRATAPCGFIHKSRPYRPHITLARSKGGPGDLLALRSCLGPPPVFTRFASSEFLLYESVLGPTGSRYHVRERFPLSRV